MSGSAVSVDPQRRAERLARGIAVASSAHLVLSLAGMLATVIRTDPVWGVVGLCTGAVGLALSWPARRGPGWAVYALIGVFVLSALAWALALALAGYGMSIPRILTSLVGLGFAIGLAAGPTPHKHKAPTSRWAARSRGLFMRRF